MTTLRHLRFAFVLASLALIAMITPSAAGPPVIEDDPGSPAELSQLGLAYDLFDRVFNDGDAAAAAELVAPDAVISTPMGEYVGPEGLLDYVAFVKRAYPDAVFDVTSIAVGERVITVEWQLTASQASLDPAGRSAGPVVVQVGVTDIATSGGEIAGIDQRLSGIETAGAADAAEVARSCPPLCDW